MCPGLSTLLFYSFMSRTHTHKHARTDVHVVVSVARASFVCCVCVSFMKTHLNRKTPFGECCQIQIYYLSLLLVVWWITNGNRMLSDARRIRSLTERFCLNEDICTEFNFVLFEIENANHRHFGEFRRPAPIPETNCRITGNEMIFFILNTIFFFYFEIIKI